MFGLNGDFFCVVLFFYLFSNQLIYHSNDN